MPINASTQESLRRLFYEGFSARDLAEPLCSFDASMDSHELRSQMQANGYRVVGIRRSGFINGYVEVHDLTDGPCGDHCQSFATHQVVPDSTSLTSVIAGLNHHARLFIAILGHVGGIVTRTDLQKPPFRMWLFGMVTLLEMRLSQMVERNWAGDEWRAYLSEGRLQKAEALLAERRRRNQDLNLLDCLQFSDKGQIVARNRRLLDGTQFTSRRRFEDVIKRLESLRNNLAHSQDILATDWKTIVELSENLESILIGTAAQDADDRHRRRSD